MTNTTLVTDGVLPTRSLSTDSRGQAIQLIGGRDYAGASSLLQPALASEPSPANQAPRGPAYLMVERYEEAKEPLAIAVAADPSNEEWRAKLTLASANAVPHVE